MDRWAWLARLLATARSRRPVMARLRQLNCPKHIDVRARLPCRLESPLGIRDLGTIRYNQTQRGRLEVLRIAITLLALPQAAFQPSFIAAVERRDTVREPLCSVPSAVRLKRCRSVTATVGSFVVSGRLLITIPPPGVNNGLITRRIL